MFVRDGGVAQDFETVVGGDAAVRGEVVEALRESGGQVVETADGVAARRFEFLQVVEVVAVFDFERFVRAEAGTDGDVKGRVGGDGGVMREVVHRVVGGADHFDVHLFEDAARGEGGFGEAGVGFVPDALCGVAV